MPGGLSPFVQLKTVEGGKSVDALSTQISSGKGEGSQIPAETLSFMEKRFGTDFSDVRIHSDANASELSHKLSAKAFTVGKDIYFNEGEYSPGSNPGRHLLAHELTHTIQQDSGRQSPGIQRQEVPGSSLPPPTGSFTLRLNDAGRVEVIVGTPELPVVGALGPGMRCENGRCQFIIGQSPFLDAERQSYTVDEAMGLLRSMGGGSSSGSPSTLPGPRIGTPGPFTLSQLPCPPRQHRNNLGICEMEIPHFPGLQQGSPSGTLTPSVPGLLSPPTFRIGDLQSSVIDHFARDSATLPATGNAVLLPLVAAINELPAGTLVHIDGHTSTEGSDDRNAQLSRERANAVKDQLMALGVTDAGKLHPAGKGASEPLVSPEVSEEDRAQNRRVEVWFFRNSDAFRFRLNPPTFPRFTP